MNTPYRSHTIFAFALISTLLAAFGLPASAVVISYQYDAAGRLTGVNYGGTSNTTYAYDKNGSLLSRTSTIKPQIAGNYAGLVSNATPAIINVGAISLKIGIDGTFTGKLALAGKSFALRGEFGPAGTTPDIIIPRTAPLPPLTLSLNLDVAGGTNQITGTLSDGVFNSTVVLDRARFDAKSPVPAGLTGTYTILFQPTQTGATIPQGHGYGTVKVTASGSLTLAAVLADGTKFSHGTSLVSANTWPLFVALYKNGGFLAGTLTFAGDPGTSDLAGPLDWQKPATTKGLYLAAFATQLDTVGSKYLVPPKGQRVLDLAATANNARVTATADGIAPLDKLITLDAANKFLIPADATKLKLTLSLPSGLLSGSYLDGTSARKFQGVIFQEQNIGAGFVTGPAETGPLLLQRTP